MQVSLQNCSMDNIYQKHFFILSEASFEVFEPLLEKNPRRSSRYQVFYKVGVLKKLANFTRKHRCWSHFLIKSPEIKWIQHRCFPGNFAKLLRTPFFTEHLRWSWSLSFKMFYIAGVHKKVFEWLAGNEFWSNSKNHRRFFVSLFLVFISIFSFTSFFY